MDTVCIVTDVITSLNRSTLLFITKPYSPGMGLEWGLGLGEGVGFKGKGLGKLLEWKVYVNC